MFRCLVCHYILLGRVKTKPILMKPAVGSSAYRPGTQKLLGTRRICTSRAVQRLVCTWFVLGKCWKLFHKCLPWKIKTCLKTYWKDLWNNFELSTNKHQLWSSDSLSHYIKHGFWICEVPGWTWPSALDKSKENPRSFKEPMNRCSQIKNSQYTDTNR